MNSLCMVWIASTTHFGVCTNEAIYTGLDTINDLKIITFSSSVRFLRKVLVHWPDVMVTKQKLFRPF